MNEKDGDLEPIAADIYEIIGTAWDKADKVEALDLYSKKQMLVNWLNESIITRVNSAGEYLTEFGGFEGRRGRVEFAFAVNSRLLMSGARLTFPSMLIDSDGSADMITLRLDENGGLIYPKDSTKAEQDWLKIYTARLAEAVVPQLQKGQLQFPIDD